MPTIDWAAPAADLYDELVELYFAAHPDYDPESDNWAAAENYAHDQIARHAR